MYYYYDGLGSTRALTDSAEGVTDTYVYEAFGDLLHRTGITENSYLFTGEQYDPNAGFYYLRARYYNAENGRFLTSDPWQGNIYDPLTIHKYLYTANNPVIFIDPSGNFFNLTDELTEIELIGIISITTGLMIAAIQESTNTGTKGITNNNNNTLTLYRGVNGKHPKLYEARMGIAVPWAEDHPDEAHKDTDEHRNGNVNSIYTSWTKYQDFAEHRADLWTKEGFAGVVLIKNFHKNDVRLISFPDDPFQEGEFLVIGVVYADNVIYR